MKKGLLIVFSGPSGVGKGSIRQKLKENYPELKYSFSISATTRKPRPQEKNGVDYFFIDEKTFDDYIKNGAFLEWAGYVGHRYGTLKGQVETLRNEGKNVFLEIEVNGAKQIMDKIKDDGLVTIFVTPPSKKDLEDRIRKRHSEDEKTITERVKRGIKELEYAENYQYVVCNDDMDKAASEVAAILKKRIEENESK